MVDAVVPQEQLALSEAPRTQIDASVFQRAPRIAEGLQQLGAGAEDLDVSLAKQQAQTDVQQQRVTLGPDGSVQVANPANSVILGRAGQEYNNAAQVGTIAEARNQITSQLAAMHQSNLLDPAGFKAAADPYVDGLRSSTNLPAGVANVLADDAANQAAQHFDNITERTTTQQVMTSKQALLTNISDLQNKLSAMARQGVTQSDDYMLGQAQLSDAYHALAGNKLYGYSVEKAQSELDTAMDSLQAEYTVGQVDQVFNRAGGGRAGAQRMLTDQVLNNPDLNLNDGERRRLYQYGMAHLDYLTSAQKASIDANRVNVSKLVENLKGGVAVDPSVVGQAVIQANSLGDAESVLKIQAYADQAQSANATKGLTDEQRLRAAAFGGGYFGALRQQENPTGNPNAGNGGGDFQFIPSTWATLAKQHPELGLTPDGRTDPSQQAKAIVAFTNDNRAALQAAGIAPTDGNTYIAHFLGAAGATSFIKAMNTNGAQPAAALFPKEAQANPSVFYKGGDFMQPRSLSEVYALQTRRFGSGTTTISAGSGVTPPTTVQMQANPFAMSAYLDAVSANRTNEVETAKTVGGAIVTRFEKGDMPAPETVAAFGQIAARHPTELQEVAQRVGNAQQGYLEAQRLDGMPEAQAQAYLTRISALKQGADLNVQASADAAQKIYDAQSKALKENPWQESARRQWLGRLPVPLDLSPPAEGQQSSIPQAIAERGEAAQNVSTFTGQQVAPLSPADLTTIRGSAPMMDGQSVSTMLTSINALPGPQVDQLMANDTFKQTVMGLAHSGDPAKMNAAFSFLDARYRANPMQFDASDPQALKELRAWQTLGSFLPPDEVAKRMAEASDPNVVKAKDALEKVAEKNLSGLDTGNIVRSVYGAHVPLIGTTIPFTSPGDIASDRPAQAAGALLADYRAAYTDMYKETGDDAGAKAYATEKLANKYSVSGLNGGRVMAYAPDRETADGTGAYYPKVGGSFDWLRDQLRVDIQQTPYFSQLRASGQSTEAARVARGQDYALLADTKTQADIAAKRSPSYQVLAIGDDGRMHLVQGDGGVPFRFRGDPSAAQAKASAEFAAQRAIGMQPYDAPMGGS